VPEMLLFLLALVILTGPTLPAPFAVGGGAELEEGGCDLKRDPGEGMCHVRWAWAGWKDDGGGFVVEEGGS